MALRDSPFSDIKVPLAWTAAAAVVVCIVIAVALLIADRRESLEAEAYGRTKAVADAIHRPISGAIAAPVRWAQGGVGFVGDYFFAVSQNRKLKEENRKLRAARDQLVALQDVNERYRALLGLKTDPPIDMVSGRAVTDARGPFANARIINVGVEGGVVVGNPVMSDNGLVGRVTGVTSGASRVLLLSDVSSRVPVMIDRTNARAILTGDGGPNPKLSFLRSREQPQSGDRILTSGDGGVMPRGLPVGVAVKGLDGNWRVQLSADETRIDFVRVLKFKDFSQLVNTQALSAPVLPTQMGGALPVPVLPPPKTPTPAAAATPGTAARPAGVVTGTASASAGAPSPPGVVSSGNPATAPAAATPASKAATPAPKTVAPAPKATTTTTPAPKAATPAPKAATQAPAATAPLSKGGQASPRPAAPVGTP